MMKMGGDWAYIEPVSEAVFVLQLNREFSEDLKNSWEIYTTTQTTSSTDGEVGKAVKDVAANSTNPKSGEADKVNTGQADKKEKEKGNGKDKGKPKSAAAKKAAAAAAAGDKGESPAGSKSKTESDLAVDAANKLKERYLKATGRAEKIMEWIPTMTEWVWADNPRHRLILSVPMQDLKQEVSKSSDIQTFIAKDVKDMNKKFGKDHLAAVAHAFNLLAAKITKVEKANSKMNDLHDIENMGSQ